MAYLRRNGYPVIGFDEATRRVRDGTMPACAVAITIDDGFYSTYAVAKPILARHKFPSTLYLTSYYFEKATPIFQLAIAYMCWRSPLKTVDLSSLGVPLRAFDRPLTLDDPTRNWVSDVVHRHGTRNLDEPGRVALSRRLGELLDVDYDGLRKSRAFSLINRRELQELEASGMAVELHTHRHRLPLNDAEALREIADNRAAIEPIAGRRLTHFCYPSGAWSPRHFRALKAAGIKTATTCESGLTHASDDPLALPRVLDDSRVTMIEFEAEMSGFCEVLRKLHIMSHYNAARLSLYRETMPSSLATIFAI